MLRYQNNLQKWSQPRGKVPLDVNSSRNYDMIFMQQKQTYYSWLLDKPREFF